MFQVVSVVLVVVNNAAANTGLYVSFPPDVCPGMGWLDHLVDDLVALFLVSYGTSILVFIVAVPVYIPTSSIGRFPFLHTLSSIYSLLIFFYDGHSFWCEVITTS